MCRHRYRLRETWRDLEKQEIEIQRREPEKRKRTGIESQRGGKETQREENSPVKDTETCLRQKQRQQQGGDI